MTRKNFINKLKKYLRTIDHKELENIINYYSEYLDDLGIDENDEIPSDMDPKKISAAILSDSTIEKKKSKSFIEILGILFIILLCSPIAIPIVIAVALFALAIISIVLILMFIPFLTLGLGAYIVTGLNLHNTILGSIGLFMIRYSILAIFLIWIFYLLKYIFNLLASIISHKVEKHKKDKYYKLYKENSTEAYNRTDIANDIKGVKISDFVGKIVIEKSEFNSISVGSNTEYTIENDIIIIKNDKHIIFNNIFEQERSILITYSSDKFNVNISDCVGTVLTALSSEGNYLFTDCVGNLSIQTTTNNKIDLNIKDTISKKNISNNIIIDPQSEIKLNIMNIVGKVNIL